MKHLTFLFLLFLFSITSSNSVYLQQNRSFVSEATLQVIHAAPRSYARFPAPTDPSEKRKLRIIEIISVGLVIALILYLLFRKRKSF